MPSPNSSQDRFAQNQWIHHALLAAGVPLATLKPGSKRIAAWIVQQSLCRDLQHVEIALDELGLNILAITHQQSMPGINPLGFADLNIDAAGHGCDISQFTYKVCRHGDRECGHYWFRMPPQYLHANPATGRASGNSWRTPARHRCGSVSS